MSERVRRRKISVVDIFAFLMICACVLSLLIAFYEKKNSPAAITESGDYYVSFTASSIRSSAAKMLEKNDGFFTDNGSTFGVLDDNVTITPAVLYAEMKDGSYVKTYAEENGDSTLVDVSGVIKVSGGKDKNGLFVTASGDYVAPARVMHINDGKISLDAEITSIERAK